VCVCVCGCVILSVKGTVGDKCEATDIFTITPTDF